MQCQRCGKDLGDSLRCSFCGFENAETGNVREMTRAEKNFYTGVTIDADSTEYNSNSQKNSNFKNHTSQINIGIGGFFSRIFTKFIRGLMNDNLLAKVIAGLIFVGLAGIFFVIAVPMMFFMLALGVAVFLYARFTGKF